MEIEEGEREESGGEWERGWERKTKCIYVTESSKHSQSHDVVT